MRQYLGEDELDRIIITNMSRGQVAELIDYYIAESRFHATMMRELCDMDMWNFID